MHKGLGVLGIGAALLLLSCQDRSVGMADLWRAQCADLGHEAGTSKMADCVSTLRGDAEADMLSAAAVY